MASKALLYELLTGDASGLGKVTVEGMKRVESYEPAAPGVVTPEEEKVLDMQAECRLRRKGFFLMQHNLRLIGPECQLDDEDGERMDSWELANAIVRCSERLGVLKQGLEKARRLTPIQVDSMLSDDDFREWKLAQEPYLACPYGKPYLGALWQVCQQIRYVEEVLLGD